MINIISNGQYERVHQLKSMLLNNVLEHFNIYKIQNKNISFAFLYFLKSSIYFVFCQFMVAQTLKKTFFINVVSIVSDHFYYPLIPKVQDKRSKLLKDAETYSKYWEFFKVDEVVPYLQGCFEG